MAETTEAPPAPDAAGATGVTRGQFLTAATLGVGGIMGGLIAVPVGGLVLTPAIKSKAFEPTRLGLVDEFTAGKFVKVVLHPGSDKPDAYVRKRVAFVRRNEDVKSDRLAIPGQGEFTVISNRCVHLGCPVQESAGAFVCPCHGGSYDDAGDRLAGPPVRPLDRFEWERRGDELWAVDEYSLTSGGKRVSRRGPGQHSGGLEGLLYPLQP